MRRRHDMRFVNAHLVGLVVALLAIHVLQSADAGLIYWLDHGGFAIRVANMDGTGDRTILSTSPYPNGLAVDPDAGTLYWTTHNAGRIHRALWDGSEQEVIVQSEHTPTGIALDVPLGTLYWGENWVDGETLRGCIMRANLDGSDAEVVVDDVAPLHMALDLSADKIYWTDRGGEHNVIMRADLDGAEVETVVDSGSGSLVTRGRGLALDPTSNKMYWTTHSDGLYRADLDGQNVELLADVPFGTLGAVTLDLDKTAMFFNWNGDIYRATLDGAKQEEMILDAGSVIKNIVSVPAPTAIVTSEGAKETS